MSRKSWESFYKTITNENIRQDDFLERYKNEIDKVKGYILDLGCGTGNTSLYLLRQGKKVIAVDYSKTALKILNKNVPITCKKKIHTRNKDILNVFGKSKRKYEMIIADLSLHYFDKKTTDKIITEIYNHLKRGGILIARLNSTNDINYGAGQGKQIEQNYYLKNGEKKRFFNQQSLEYFFRKFYSMEIQEESMLRYADEKIVWICKLTK